MKNNLPYKVALRLKDAGFKQEGRGLWQPGYLKTGTGKITVESIYIPTTGELIEACGDKFGTLEQVEVIKIYDDGKSKKRFDWFTTATVMLHDDKPGAISHMIGKNPKIALAELYIKLNT